MKLLLMTQHSPDGASAGLQTLRVEPNLVELGDVEWEAYPGGQFLALPATVAQAFQFPTQVNAMHLKEGPYLQVEDKIVQQADSMLKFASPIVDRDAERAIAEILSEGHD